MPLSSPQLSRPKQPPANHGWVTDALLAFYDRCSIVPLQDYPKATAIRFNYAVLQVTVMDDNKVLPSLVKMCGKVMRVQYREMPNYAVK